MSKIAYRYIVTYSIGRGRGTKRMTTLPESSEAAAWEKVPTGARKMVILRETPGRAEDHQFFMYAPMSLSRYYETVK